MFEGAWPGWDIGAVLGPLVLARALWLAALVSASGALAFRAMEGSGEAMRSAAVRRRLSRLVAGSLAGACAAWAAWVVLQAAEIAGADSPGSAVAALMPVLSRTLFGHAALLQLGFLLLASAALRLGGWWGQAVPALAALAATGLQVLHLHAFAMWGWGSGLTVAVVLHLCAAALWLGGLPPLRAVVQLAPLPAARAAVRRFSARATVLVAVLAATALAQGVALGGGSAGLVGTAYGWMMLAKAALFAGLLAMAAHHRFRLTPKLAGPNPDAARAALSRGIAVETGVGLLALLAAAVLTALPPGMHMEQASATTPYFVTEE